MSGEKVAGNRAGQCRPRAAASRTPPGKSEPPRAHTVHGAPLIRCRLSFQFDSPSGGPYIMGERFGLPNLWMTGLICCSTKS